MAGKHEIQSKLDGPLSATDCHLDTRGRDRASRGSSLLSRAIREQLWDRMWDGSAEADEIILAIKPVG